MFTLFYSFWIPVCRYLILSYEYISPCVLFSSCSLQRIFSWNFFLIFLEVFESFSKRHLDAFSQKHAAKSWSTKRLLLTNIGSLGSIVWSCLTVFIPGRQHVSFLWKQKQREREQLLHAAVRTSCMKTKNVCILPYQAPNCFRMLQPFHASSSSMFEDESWRCMTHSFDKSSANIHFWMYCPLMSFDRLSCMIWAI
jgi:hypothetical protein